MSDTVNEPRACADCGEPTYNDKFCRDCGLERMVAEGSCRECGKWIMAEEYGGPAPAQHVAGCSLANAHYWPRSEEEIVTVRRLKGWTS